MHRFVREVLSQSELRSILILAAATLIVWPVIPDRYVGPFAAINPRALWQVVILILAISAVGHTAVRGLGARFGLPLAGLASPRLGFHLQCGDDRCHGGASCR
jgi:uncharacterized membrane protein (DUF4010 family)